ncbi:hypothetical protein CLV59_104161 [Chitinophaga dinghuensis]|uniref:Dolichyl-phosphate-mannose-protein mannosyltransferase n=1 Tax=Chitinophaga dinghuensis TaxID=1539050 RepID=A0A327W116_9BACT|nr:hypothetical protein [Chitinophaga dinghuensis]RAJ81936.1 hypothetical protein CLV59_104161 [Chitinophaga dinghuensis]
MNLISLFCQQPLLDRESVPFRQFVFQQPRNRKFLFAAIILTIVQFVLFKMLYPFPDFISDSSSYIDSNLEHLKVNLWPIGYSYFIAFIHWMSPSHVFLIAVQYLILQATLLYVFFSASYLLQLRPVNSTIFFIFLIVNPALLYLSNCVLSDTLFLSISMIIFMQYLWMFRRPKLSYLLIQGILIGVAFTIRYTAIYYPLVALLAIPFAHYKLPAKLMGIILPWVFILPFISYTQQQTKAITGTAEFSVFGGWQIANNALYMYGHIQVDSTQLPPEMRKLDRYAKIFFTKIAPTDKDLAELPGTYFIKMPNAILKPYLIINHKWGEHPTAKDMFKSWGTVSPVYNAYGKYLIKKYPFSFMRYYMWLNTKTYFSPHLEKFTNYNLGMKEMWASPQKWFQLESPAVYKVPPTYVFDLIGNLYKWLFAALNFYFAVSVIFLFTGRKKTSGSYVSFAGVWLAIFFVIINFGFSVFATPVVLRYQFIPMIIMVLFCLHINELSPSEDKPAAANA